VFSAFYNLVKQTLRFFSLASFFEVLNHKFSGILIKRNNQEDGQPQGIAPTNRP